MVRISAGTLLHRPGPSGVEVLLVHMGGPLWARKDARAWSIPKGEMTADENPRHVAAREFAEELGSPLPDGPEIDLGSVRQSGGKVVHAAARLADFDASAISSNTFELEWPPRSGRTQSFPEVDRAAWFDLPTAREKIVVGQVPLLDRLAEALRQAG